MVRTYDPTGPCVVELAQILEVYPDTYSCQVSTVHGHRNIPDVKFTVPALHQERGAGFNFMPEAGDICYVFTPADGTGSFIMGYVYVEDPDTSPSDDPLDQDSPDFRGERPKLLPGDMHLSTSDGNFVVIRKGGVVQVGASHLAQRVYIPIENVIRDYYVRYHGFSPIGEIIWDHSQITSDAITNEDVTAIVKFSCRENLADEKTSIEVRVGCLDRNLLDATVNSNLIQEGIETKVGEDEFTGAGDEEHLIGFNRNVDGLGFAPDPDNSPPGLLSLTINPQGEGVKYTFQVDKIGNNFIRSEAHIHIEAEEGYFVSASQDSGVRHQTSSNIFTEIKDYIKAQVEQSLIEILSNGNINIKGNDVQLKANGEVSIKAGSTMTLEAPIIKLLGDNIQLGRNGAFDLLANASVFKTLLETHTHSGVTTGPGTSGPPNPPTLVGAITTSNTPSKIKVG